MVVFKYMVISKIELVCFDSLLSGVFYFLQCNFHFLERILDKSMQDMKLYPTYTMHDISYEFGPEVDN